MFAFQKRLFSKKLLRESIIRLNLPHHKALTKEEIKQAYFTLAQKHHPDKSQSDKHYFQEVKESYDHILSNYEEYYQYIMKINKEIDSFYYSILN